MARLCNPRDVRRRWLRRRFGTNFGLTTIPRIGLDVGTEHLRFRPAVEANVAFLGNYDHEIGGVVPAFGIGLTTAIAYQW